MILFFKLADISYLCNTEDSSMAWFVTVPISGVISAAIMAIFKYVIFERRAI